MEHLHSSAISRLAFSVLIASSLLAAACGNGVGESQETQTLASVSSGVPIEPAVSTASDQPPDDITDGAEVVDDGTDSVQLSGRYYAVYAGEERIWYQYAFTDELSSLNQSGPNEFQMAPPFGVAPTNRGRLTIDGVGGPFSVGPASPVTWPAYCLGIRPDVDGDALLDECDPYPEDGPRADYDGDGVLNSIDNCPTISNPFQERVGDRSNGLVCDQREGLADTVGYIVADASLEGWNAVRADQGLAPIVMPDPEQSNTPEIAAWCEDVTRAYETLWEGRENGESPDSGRAGVRLIFRSIPEEYGMTQDQVDEMLELAYEFDDLVLSEGSDAWIDHPDVEDGQQMAKFQRHRELVTELRPYFAVFRFSDVSCP